MGKRSLLFLFCIGIILSFSLAKVLHSNEDLAKHQPVQLSVEQLQERAKSITVKILSGESIGSGSIVDRQGSTYTVITNQHVLRSAKPPYQIETAQGQIYAANLLPTVSFDEVDLSLLQFTSSETSYEIASIGSFPDVGDRVFVAGFPLPKEASQHEGFSFRTGKVSLVLDKALQGGYSVGYTNYVEKGMSGGPLLNLCGEVVSINGMHAEPLWGDPYLYEDGSQPDRHLKQEMSRYSWGIPIETYLQRIINK